ncbi:MAG TPA: hypothetical protein VGA00_11665 [Acidiferrobacterales bacterium]|jgi:hypothetical protein
MSRFKAFLIHLGISAAIFMALVGMIVFVWYPQPFFAADGGWQGIRIIAGVDLVLGPTLTLIVFKPGKKGLKFDLTLIGLAQAAALAWGIWIVHDQRTALVTYADGAFYSLTPERIALVGDKAIEIMQSAERPPAYAFVRLPADPGERLAFKKWSIFAGAPLYQHGDRYEPLGPGNLPEVFERSLPLESYLKRSEQHTAWWQAFLDRHGGSAADYALVPLYCRYADLILVLRRADGGIVDSLEAF